MPQISGYPNIPKYSVVPTGPFDRGLDRQTARSFLEAGFVPSCQNVWVDRGIIKQRGGYELRKKATKTTGAAFETALGRPIIGQAIYTTTGGDEKELIFDSVYAWDYSYSAGTKSSLFVNADPTPKNLAYGTGDENSVLSWTLAPHTDATSRIVFTDGTTVPDWATGTNYAVGNLIKGPSTALNYYTCITAHTASAVFGDDSAKWAVSYTGDIHHTLFYWAGSSAVELLPVETGFFTSKLTFAKQVIYFADHLMIGNYGEGSAEYPQGVAWGTAGNVAFGFRAFVDGDDTGEFRLTDAKGAIVRFIRLGAHLAIYCEGSIVMCDPVPSDAIYSFDTRIQGTGLLGPNAVVDVGGMHVFVGKDNIYLYDGGLALQPIGDRIFDKFFETLNPDKAHRIVGQHIPQENLAIFYYPTGTAKWSQSLTAEPYTQDYVAYDYRRDTWVFGHMGDIITSSGFGIQTSTWECDDEPFVNSKCDGTTPGKNFSMMKCSDFSLKSGYEVPTLGTYTGFLLDDTEMASTDRGQAFLSSFETDSKPIGNPYGTWGRVIEIHVNSRGYGQFSLLYSTRSEPDIERTSDSSSEWTLLGSFGGSGEGFQTQEIPVDISGQFLACRVEFPAGASSCEVRTISFRARPTSEGTI